MFIRQTRDKKNTTRIRNYTNSNEKIPTCLFMIVKRVSIDLHRSRRVAQCTRSNAERQATEHIYSGCNSKKPGDTIPERTKQTTLLIVLRQVLITVSIFKKHFGSLKKIANSPHRLWCASKITDIFGTST
jgi:hypothetical protein